MIRGNLYRVANPGGDAPKRQRVFVVVSRQVLIDSNYSTVICAPVYNRYDGLSTQVPVGVSEGLKPDSSIHCDALVSLPKSALTNYIGQLPEEKLDELDEALRTALDLPDA